MIKKAPEKCGQHDASLTLHTDLWPTYQVSSNLLIDLDIKLVELS